MEKVTTAIVLSGGGGKGSFQAGALAALYERGIRADIVAGVSVGSLNGAMLAQNKLDRLIEVWQTLTEGDIFTKPSLARMLINNFLLHKTGLYDASPLRNFIRKEVVMADMVLPFKIGFTSLEDGKYYSVCTEDFYTEEDFQTAIFASSLMPVIWQGVDVTTKHNRFLKCVDGGIRNNTPLGDVLSFLPDTIYILSCNRPDLNADSPDTLLKVASRTILDIMLSEILDNDVQTLLRINSLVKQANANGYALTNPDTGKVYKYFEVVYIQPPYALQPALDFSRPTLDAQFKLGVKTGELHIRAKGSGMGFGS